MVTQVDLKKINNTVMISKRPINISVDRIHLAAVGRSAKLAPGPVAPEPMPRLLKHVMNAMLASSKLIPVKVNVKMLTTKRIMKSDRKLQMRFTVNSSKVCPDSFTEYIPVG